MQASTPPSNSVEEAIKIKDIMQECPVTIQPDAQLGVARDLMAESKIRHLPVVENDQVVGVLTDRDISNYAERTGESIWSGGLHPVSAAMETVVETTSSEESIADAMARLASDKIGCLPVLLNGKLVGIVTTTDLLGAQAIVLGR